MWNEADKPGHRERDPFEEAWRRLIEYEGVGPSRLRAVVLLDPECREYTCSWFDHGTGGCRQLDAGIPWSRGACRWREYVKAAPR